MNNADMLIHVHPDLDAQAREKLEKNIEHHIGVSCAEFSHRPHSHALLVRYDSDTVEGEQILNIVREVDPEATRAGL